MLGRSHALSGAAAGAGVSVFLHATVAATATAAVLTAGFATVNDLDHPCATAAKSLGFVSQAFAWVVGKVSGGHRHGTHSLVGVAVFTALAWLACHYRATIPGKAGLVFTVTLAVAAGLRALRLGGHHADLLALGAAAAVTWGGWGVALIPVACAVGTTAHLVGDACTDQGIPVAWPLSRVHVRLLPEPLAFTTGTRPERWVVAPLLMLVLGGLALYVMAVPGITS